MNNKTLNNKTYPYESAFPEVQKEPRDDVFSYGLDKREYFAAMAMQGLLTRVPKRQSGEVDLGILEAQRIATEAVIMADKIIDELNLIFDK
jgi:hypothetical protein